MNSGTLDESHVSPRYLAIIGFVVAALLSSWMYFGFAPKANAENFCLGVNLARFGQPGDSCTAPNGGWVYLVVVESTGNAGGEQRRRTWRLGLRRRSPVDPGLAESQQFLPWHHSQQQHDQSWHFQWRAECLSEPRLQMTQRASRRSSTL
jgi:hypothetical protein